jgi:hypothetical protein
MVEDKIRILIGKQKLTQRTMLRERKRKISLSRNRERKKKRDSIWIDTTHIVKCTNYLLRIQR